MRSAALILLIAFLPLVGAWAADREIGRIVAFPPPLQIPVGYPTFSWIATALVVLPLAAFVAAWVRRSSETRQAFRPKALAAFATQKFPLWGYLALAWLIAWWILAWNRFDWFAAFQPYTFFPLWLGFIVVVNAVTRWRTGTCLLTRAPRQWLLLFAASGLFWWIFEWLNRFARNWHYLGADEFSALGYAFHATICFSTVLPAVHAVRELIGSAGSEFFARGPCWKALTGKFQGGILFLAGVVGLAGTGVYPEFFYPALWVAPLLLFVGGAIFFGREGPWNQIAVGDWREAMPWMLAALGCGFFWEMWNYPSLPKWIYTVPYCDRWHLFEMPALGYAGYLPFGTECSIAAALVVRPNTTASPPVLE